MILTAFTVALATALPRAMRSLAGAERIGALLMQVFFATIGASAHIGTVLQAGTALLALAGIITLVHLVTVLAVGRLARLDLAEIVVASNANMGGPTTAAAMAISRRWHSLVMPAILCGTLGCATATFVGVALGHALR